MRRAATAMERARSRARRARWACSCPRWVPRPAGSAMLAGSATRLAWRLAPSALLALSARIAQASALCAKQASTRTRRDRARARIAAMGGLRPAPAPGLALRAPRAGFRTRRARPCARDAARAGMLASTLRTTWRRALPARRACTRMNLPGTAASLAPWVVRGRPSRTRLRGRACRARRAHSKTQRVRRSASRARALRSVPPRAMTHLSR